MNEDMDIVLIDHHINGSKAQNIYTYDICMYISTNNPPKGDRSAGFYIKERFFGKIQFWDFWICGK